MASGEIYDYFELLVKIYEARDKFLKENGSLDVYQFTALISAILDEYFIQNGINVKEGWNIVFEVVKGVHKGYYFSYPDTDSIK